MAFDIDTRSYLNQIKWKEFHEWKGEWPFYAGRYFGPPEDGYPTWDKDEFAIAKQETNNALTRIFPIRPQYDVQQDGTYDQGANDGADTCQRILNALPSETELDRPLRLPPGGIVHVWLDAEPPPSPPGTPLRLSLHYWAGFSHQIYNYVYRDPETHTDKKPFRAAIYCGYAPEAPGGKYLPPLAVRDTLNTVHSHYPAHHTLCYGFWTYEPTAGAPRPGVSGCWMCSPTYYPSTEDWAAFGEYRQPHNGTNTLVKLYIHQYAQPSFCNTCPEWPNWGAGQPVDLDSTSTTGAENYALVIA
jgi:hypothetical protein